MATATPSKRTLHQVEHFRADELESVLRQIRSEGQAGKLTINFSTGGRPSGTIEWTRSVSVGEPNPSDVSLTGLVESKK